MLRGFRLKMGHLALLLALFGTTLVSAQNTATTTTSTTPAEQSWTPGFANCTNGLPNPATPSGAFTDVNGAVYNIECNQDSSGAYYNAGDASNQGFAACFNGCDERPGCTGFSYQGSVTGKDASATRCNYFC